MKTILTFMGWYLPGSKSGGPVRTLSNLIAKVGDEYTFKVLAADRDMGDIASYDGIDVGTWNRVGKGDVYYLPPGLRGLLYVFKILRSEDYDLIYLNSFFSFKFSILPTLLKKIGFGKNVPLLIGPRGEFSRGALSLKSVKKRVYLYLASFFRLYSHASWQASSEYEKSDILNAMGVGAKIVVAEDIASQPDRISQSRRDQNTLRIVFFSRISPKKNLLYACKILSNVRVPVCFDIFGPIEDVIYWETCQSCFKQLPKNITFNYGGVLRPDEVTKVVGSYDLFLFPTLGENFGHVIAESLGVGTPVLLSDQTPWRALSTHGVGWDIPLDDTAAYVKCIEACYHIPLSDYNLWRQRICEWAKLRLENVEIVEKNRLMFVQVIGS